MENGNQPMYPINDLNENISGLSGLTKREHFAAMAMQGLLASRINVKGYEIDGNIRVYAKSCVKLADELLKQLKE